MTQTNITTDDVAKIAQLASLTVSEEEKQLFAGQFSTTVDVINQLNEVDTKGTPPTSSVTKLENVTRSDIIDTDRVLPQAVALSGAKNVHQGFFVVKQILKKDNE